MAVNHGKSLARSPYRKTVADNFARSTVPPSGRPQGALGRGVMRLSVLALTCHRSTANTVVLPIIQASGSALGTCRGGENYAT